MGKRFIIEEIDDGGDGGGGGWRNVVGFILAVVVLFTLVNLIGGR